MPACTGRLGWSLSAGQGARAECTLNISPIILTRDVSKFTGWLNAVAACRGGGYDGKVSLGAGRACVARKRRLDWSLGTAGHGRHMHLEHFVHVCDAGRVKV